MQLGFHSTRKRNAQVINTYIGVIISNNRMCTGAYFRAAAQHWGALGLGPTPHEPPAAGLAPCGSCGSATTSYTISSAAAATRMHMI